MIDNSIYHLEEFKMISPISNTCNQIFFKIKNNIISPLTAQKRIHILALVIFGSLVAIYLVYRCCKGKVKHLKNQKNEHNHDIINKQEKIEKLEKLEKSSPIIIHQPNKNSQCNEKQEGEFTDNLEKNSPIIINQQPNKISSNLQKPIEEKEEEQIKAILLKSTGLSPNSASKVVQYIEKHTDQIDEFVNQFQKKSMYGSFEIHYGEREMIQTIRNYIPLISPAPFLKTFLIYKILKGEIHAYQEARNGYITFLSSSDIPKDREIPALIWTKETIILQHAKLS